MEPSIEVLDKMAAYYGLTIDDIVHLDKDIPKEVVMEDKTSAEQVRLIAQLEVVLTMIDISVHVKLRHAASQNPI